MSLETNLAQAPTHHRGSHHSCRSFGLIRRRSRDLTLNFDSKNCKLTLCVCVHAGKHEDALSQL